MHVALHSFVSWAGSGKWRIPSQKNLLPDAEADLSGARLDAARLKPLGPRALTPLARAWHRAQLHDARKDSPGGNAAS